MLPPETVQQTAWSLWCCRRTRGIAGPEQMKPTGVCDHVTRCQSSRPTALSQHKANDMWRLAAVLPVPAPSCQACERVSGPDLASPYDKDTVWRCRAVALLSCWKYNVSAQQMQKPRALTWGCSGI